MKPGNIPVSYTHLHQEQHADEEDERRPVLGARLSGVGLAGGDDVVGVIRSRAAVGVLQRDGAEFLARELLLDDESLAVGRGGGQVRVIERLLGCLLYTSRCV